MTRFRDTAVVVGAGFSSSAGLPLTADLSRYFLDLGETFPTPRRIQEGITRQLQRFWEDIFGYEAGAGNFPSFEDHFTALDIAANAGHNLGRYSPTQLRALRRLSIHRIFDLLDASYKRSTTIDRFLAELGRSPGASLISTNWDVVVENHLVSAGIPYTYCVPGWWDFESPPPDAFPLIKLHGSANWHYCDWCRRVGFGTHGKTALISRTFLEARDFRVLGEDDLIEDVERATTGGRPCRPPCHNPRMTARVATFSYSKAFDFFLFQAAWDAALTLLREASYWLFIGYSLPEADFAFKHLLKTAEAASLGSGPKQMRAVSRDGTGLVRERYSRFFGSRLVDFYNEGLDTWVSTTLHI